MAFPQAQALPGGGQFLQTPRFTPEQSQIMQNLLGLGAQTFNPMAQEDLARKKFTSETIPGLAERFTAMPGGGGQRSSAFRAALGQAASDLESNLAAQRMNFGREALGIGLQPQFESHLQPSPYQGLATGIGSALPQLAELGGKYLLGGKGGTAEQPQQNSNIGSTIGQVAGALAPAAGGALASGGGFGAALSGLGSGLAAAAPVALPVLAGAAVIGTLAYLLSGD